MLTLLAAAVAIQAPIPGWSMFVSTQDHFTVELPGKPAVTTRTSSSQGVSGTTRNYTVKTPAINAVVSATVLNTTAPQVTQDVAKGIKIGLMRSIGGKPGPDLKAVYSGRTGTETRFQDSSGHFGALWVTTTPGKVYSLTVLAPKGVPKAEAKRFFTSFHLG